MRWDIDQHYSSNKTAPGKVYCRNIGALDNIEYFDSLFFMMSPLEAEGIDPQHRLFMQEGFRAFEDAGYTRSSLNNANCGVYMGIMSGEYTQLVAANPNNALGAGNSFATGAARLSYFLNLKGPAVPIDTACSSSLVSETSRIGTRTCPART